MTLPEPPAPTLRLKLDRDALASNWRVLDRMSGNASAGAAVKANAYGLGATKAVPVLREAGCRNFFVAHWSEAPELLPFVPADEISVLHGPLNAQEADFARAVGVRPVLNSLDQVRRWLESGGGPCDLMVDSGINRLGLPLDAIGDPMVRQLEIDTVMSHLASADENSAFNHTQLARSREAFATIGGKRHSLANSAGIALGNDYAFDLTRPGLSLYGGVPRAEMANVIRQVAAPQAAIMQLRELRPGDSVGYNATFVAQHAMRVGVAAIGYADGYLRCWAGKGVLQHGDANLPVLGRVSMDMVVVDLTKAPELREGDWLDVPWSLPEAASQSGLSQYELLTVLGRRLRG